MKKLILISGKAQHGKDTTAEYLKEKLPGKVLITHYADYLKYICKEYFGWNGKKDEKGRTILQKVGTELFRAKDEGFWVETLCRAINVLQDEFDYIIIADCRFPNEVDVPKQLFGDKAIAVKVIRLNYISHLTEEQQRHPSETALDHYMFDYHIEAESGLHNLHKEVDMFIRYLNR